MYLGKNKKEHVRHAHDQSKTPICVDNFLNGITVNARFSSRTFRARVVFRTEFHPVERLPVVLSSDYVAEGADRGAQLYNCSRPYTVPDLWKCDMVQQCFSLEDEPADCPYRNSSDCGPLWVQYSDLCLHVMADYGFIEDVGKSCKVQFDAVQMPLGDRALREFVANVVRTVLRKPGDVHFLLRRVNPVYPTLVHLYRHLWQWGDQGSPIDYLQLRFAHKNLQEDCVVFLATSHYTEWTRCTKDILNNYLLAYACVRPLYPKATSTQLSGGRFTKASTHLSGKHPGGEPKLIKTRNVGKLRLAPSKFNRSLAIHTKTCPDGSFVQTFHPCPSDDSVWSEAGLPLFQCWHGPAVHYTVVCDGAEDCSDGSDENGCDKADLSAVLFTIRICQNQQPIAFTAVCNGAPDCFDGSDESLCEYCRLTGFQFCEEVGCMPLSHFHYSCPTERSNRAVFLEDIPPPARVDPTGYGLANVSRLADGESCPETHFQCSVNTGNAFRDNRVVEMPNRNASVGAFFNGSSAGYCIPTYLLSNGEQDCPLGDDEIQSNTLACPGYYRCLKSGSCVHLQYVCDGMPHCPHKDDEQYCASRNVCPTNCTCEGQALTCDQMFPPYDFPFTRYLHLRKPQQSTLREVHQFPFLSFLNVSMSKLTNVSFSSLPLLYVLDLSHNHLHDLRSLNVNNLPRLEYLYLSGNPLIPRLGSDTAPFTALARLKTLALADTGLRQLNPHALSRMRQLAYLDISDNFLSSIDKDIFAGLDKLRTLRVENHRLCCYFYHQHTDLQECFAPWDELSSCSDMLSHGFYLVCLWVFCVLAFTGNAGVIVYRICFEKKNASVTFRLFVVSLSLSDWLMSVYLCTIGTVDSVFRGQFVSRETEWKTSKVCKAAGFIGLLSSEVSAFSVCLITLDRFLVICFPFSYHFHFTKRSALAACVTAWGAGLLLASVPLLLPHWQFYGQNAICLPFPITRAPFAGQSYAFGVFIILNLIVFLSIGAGQAVIFYSIRRSAEAAMQDRRKQEVAVARQLFSVVITDFCCWFPIGLMGLLASLGVPIPSQVNVLAAVFLLPINSAVNPFLYTLAKVLEIRAKKRLQKLITRLMSQLETELKSWPQERIEGLVQHCFKANLLDRDVFRRRNE